MVRHLDARSKVGSNGEAERATGATGRAAAVVAHDPTLCGLLDMARNDAPLCPGCTADRHAAAAERLARHQEAKRRAERDSDGVRDRVAQLEDDRDLLAESVLALQAEVAELNRALPLRGAA